jgi:competence ComEA-like helix-hairpin-helix protein
VHFTKSEARVAVILCLLALLAAGLRLLQYRALERHALPFDPAPADSAVLDRVARELESRKLPLDVNSASPRALERLEGIGPKLAGRIIEERNRGGPFADAENLAARVRGIGALTIERLAPQLTFRNTAQQEQ